MYNWWCGTFFHNIWNNDPNWLIFFRGVETTNHKKYIYIYKWWIFRHTMFDYRRVMLFNPKGSSVFGGLGLAMVCFTWAGWRFEATCGFEQENTAYTEYHWNGFHEELKLPNWRCKLSSTIHFLGTPGDGWGSKGASSVPWKVVNGRGYVVANVKHFPAWTLTTLAWLLPDRIKDLIVKKFWSERNRKRRTSKNHSFGGYRMMLPRCYINHAPVHSVSIDTLGCQKNWPVVWTAAVEKPFLHQGQWRDWRRFGRRQCG